MTIRPVKYYQLLGKTMVYQREKGLGGGDILSVESVNQRDREEGREREKGRMRQREHRAKRAQSRQ